MDDAVLAARNFQFLAYGLIAIWAILLIYVLTLVGREGRIRSQLEVLKRMVEDREGRK
jgi:hypothetical protein